MDGIRQITPIVIEFVYRWQDCRNANCPETSNAPCHCVQSKTGCLKTARLLLAAVNANHSLHPVYVTDTAFGRERFGIHWGTEKSVFVEYVNGAAMPLWETDPTKVR